MNYLQKGAEVLRILPDFNLASFEALGDDDKAKFWEEIRGLRFESKIWHYTHPITGESFMNVKPPITLLPRAANTE